MCGKAYQHQSALSGHIRVHHRNVTYDCSKCGKVLKYKKSLELHQALCFVEKPEGVEGEIFVCKECKQVFTSRNELWTHENENHKEIRKFICDHCGYGFKRQSALDRHCETAHGIGEKRPRRPKVKKEKEQDSGSGAMGLGFGDAGGSGSASVGLFG